MPGSSGRQGLDAEVLKDVRSMRAPPQLVKDLVEVMFLMLGEKPGLARNWKHCTTAMKTTGPCNFLDRINDFKPEVVTPEVATRVHRLIGATTPAFTKKVSLSAYFLHLWIDDRIALLPEKKHSV